MFYLKTRDSTGALNGIQVAKMKNKLGTRQLPTAELLLSGTEARLVGAEGRGIATIANMLTISRLQDPLIWQPLGFCTSPLKMSWYRSMLSELMAPLKVMVIIWGAWAGSMLPGTLVPSGEQKQSGSWHWERSQSGARFGSWSTVQAFSSEPSAQSGVSSQKSAFAMHSPFPHCSWPSGQTGSSVFRLGSARFALESLSQLSTFAFQLQVCPNMSKARPAGQRTAASLIVPARPALSHLTTSLQSPPSESAFSLKYSSERRSLQSSSGLRRSSSSSERADPRRAREARRKILRRRGSMMKEGCGDGHEGLPLCSDGARGSAD